MKSTFSGEIVINLFILPYLLTALKDKYLQRMSSLISLVSFQPVENEEKLRFSFKYTYNIILC